MRFYLSFLISFISVGLYAQSYIELNNPSFEKGSGKDKLPVYWFNCGYSEDYLPDVHSAKSDYFNVKIYPYEGKSAIGLSVRPKHIFEGIGQELSKPLQKGKLHELNFYALKVDAYYTEFERTQIAEQAVVLVLWGGNNPCDQTQLLTESPVLDFKQWTKVDISFVPKRNYKYVFLEVRYIYWDSYPYYGNVILDAFSKIKTSPIEAGLIPIFRSGESPGYKAVEALNPIDLYDLSSSLINSEESTLAIDPIRQPILMTLISINDIRESINNQGLQKLLRENASYVENHFDALYAIDALDQIGILEELLILVEEKKHYRLSDREKLLFQQFDTLIKRKEWVRPNLELFIQDNWGQIIDELKLN